MSSGSRIRLGVLTRTYGLGGGIRCTLDSEAFPSIATPCDAWTGYSEAFLQPIRLERYERRPEDLILYFAGITTREEAEGLFDRALFLPAEALSYEQHLSHPLLVGYEVRNEAGETLGTIAAIFKTPAHFIWSVTSGDREWMVPAIDQFVVDLRHDDRVAIVRTIPGMVEDLEEHDDER
jgi:16S rRNA processing protein RimM